MDLPHPGTPGPDDPAAYGESIAGVYDDWYADVSDVEGTVATVAGLGVGHADAGPRCCRHCGRRRCNRSSGCICREQREGFRSSICIATRRRHCCECRECTREFDGRAAAP